MFFATARQASLRLASLAFFRLLGVVFFCCFKKRRKIAIKNIIRCLPVDHKRAKAIARKSFISLGHTLGDFLLLPKYTKKNIDRYVSIKHLDVLKEAVASKRGVILVGAHFGSWELAAHALALHDLPSLIVYNKFKASCWFEGYAKRRRELSGNKLILKEQAMLPLYKHLKIGRMATLVVDQHAHPPLGIKIPFFGIDAWTHTSFAKMSLKTGALVVPGFMFINGLFRYTINFETIFDPDDFRDKPDPVYSMVLAFNQELEVAIKRAPEQWMWQHRRFKKV
ncbi:lysophospholipid acyltransferase family protein [Candidatus Babeliales bacterium]|nr:lysophospholipid acyltransferase family protein [Candidatus Babeliales bacterium]